MPSSSHEACQPVAVTKYTTWQVSDDKWTYGPSETRVFQPHETIADIVAWARKGGNVHWRDLVFSPLHSPEPLCGKSYFRRPGDDRTHTCMRPLDHDGDCGEQ